LEGDLGDVSIGECLCMAESKRIRGHGFTLERCEAVG